MKPVTTFLNILWHPFTVWCVTYEKFANYINMIIKDIKQREGSRRPLPLMTCSPAGGVGRGRGCRDEGYLPAEALIDQTFCTLHRLQTPSPALGQLGWVGGGYVRGRRTVPTLSSSPLYHSYRVCTHTPNETQRVDVVVSLLWVNLLLISWPPVDQLTSSWSPLKPRSIAAC